MTQINEVECATNLSHFATEDELFNTGKISVTEDMYITLADGQETRYTDETQKIFDRWYDYFYDAIISCKID